MREASQLCRGEDSPARDVERIMDHIEGIAVLGEKLDRPRSREPLEKRRRRLGLRHEDGRREQRGERGVLKRVGHPPRRCARRQQPSERERRQQAAQRRTGDLHDDRARGVVRPRNRRQPAERETIRAEGQHDVHGEGRSAVMRQPEQPQTDDREHRARADQQRPAPAHQIDDQRPDQIELFLQRERPEMVDRRGDVIVLDGDQEIGRVQPQPRHFPRGFHRLPGVERDDLESHHEQVVRQQIGIVEREDAQGAARVEIAEEMRVVLRAHQDAGNQITGEHEEQIDAARHPVEHAVEEPIYG